MAFVDNMRKTRILDPSDLGAEIRRRRKLLGITQEELGETLGFSPRLVGDIERGKGGVAFEKVLRCCMEVGIRVFSEAGIVLTDPAQRGR